MTEENEVNLIIDKLEVVSKKRRRELLWFFIERVSSSDKDRIVDFLNYKKVNMDSNNIAEGDYVLVPLGISVYPSLNREAYEKRDLIDKQDQVRVKVVKISPIESYCWIEAYTGLNIVSQIKTYNSNLPKQEDLFDL